MLMEAMFVSGVNACSQSDSASVWYGMHNCSAVWWKTLQYPFLMVTGAQAGGIPTGDRRSAGVPVRGRRSVLAK